VEHDERAGSAGGPESACSTLPVSRSFVVQFGADILPTAKRYRGRVEHIESGRSGRFDSLDDLVAFFAAAIEATESE
jgi:hypothetical protein